MTASKNAIARAHHFVPKCWLAGFTATGQNDDLLWVTDLLAKEQWQSSPTKTGHRRDFYRITDPNFDPLLFENKFADIEAHIAPILRRVHQERRPPTRDELESLLTFMAIQFVRVPAFRPVIHDIIDKEIRSRLSDSLGSKESWESTLLLAGISTNSPGADYEGAVAASQSDDIILSLGNEVYLKQGFQAALDIIPSIEKRHWGALVSETGSFVASDNPVALDGEPNKGIGFANAEIVVFPVSRHVLLYGTNYSVDAPFVNRMLIARQNTFAMLTSEQYIYSHRSDFCWLDENNKLQTDWKLFSKNKIMKNAARASIAGLGNDGE